MPTSTPTGTVSGVTENISEAASEISRHASSLGQMSADKVAGGAHTAASALRSTVGYLRTNDLKSMMGDLQELVKDHPGPALLTAAALGFLLARTVSRN